MHPILFHLGPATIYSYGVAIAAAFFVGITLASKRAKKEGLDPNKIIDLCFYILIAAIVGSRLLYVGINISYFIKNPLDIFKLWQGGLVFYGGLIGAVIVAVLYLKKKRLPVWRVADLLAPSLALGQSIGRLGCFLAGCCYGKPTEGHWGVTFSDPDSLAPLHVSLHPTQLYSSFLDLAIFFALLYIQKIKKFQGQVFWTYLFLYSTGRFIIEFFRGDKRGFVFEGILSTSQFIGIFMFALSIFMYLRGRSSSGT
ncbi:MAG: prolipoprotein diacylglyceryl transferase [Nitrospinae bacterium]|nr:prolipoprotein diacylglyceryl transferase [Nitrospinota bacterium]